MSFNFAAQSLAGAPTVLSPPAKDIQVKAVKLTFADFSTGGTTALKAVLPADASIIGFRTWVKTQLSGGSVSAAAITVGQAGGSASFYVTSTSVFGAVGTYNVVATAPNLFQDYNIPWGADLQLTVTGTATTGNPTAGEVYLLVEYVR